MTVMMKQQIAMTARRERQAKEGEHVENVPQVTNQDNTVTVSVSLESGRPTTPPPGTSAESRGPPVNQGGTFRDSD